MMLSAPAGAHPEDSVRVLAMGFDYCFEGVMSTKILSHKMNYWILDAILSFLSLLRHTFSESYERSSDFSFLLSFFSDLLFHFLLKLLDCSKIISLSLESTACRPVVCTVKYFPASFILWNFPAVTLYDLSLLGN